MIDERKNEFTQAGMRDIGFRGVEVAGAILDSHPKPCVCCENPPLLGDAASDPFEMNDHRD